MPPRSKALGLGRLCRAVTAAACVHAAAVHAQENSAPTQVALASLSSVQALQLPSVWVQATALPGGWSIDMDKVPANIQTLSAQELSVDGSASMARALDTRLGSVNVNDNLNDPFQPDVLYRGFAASPVLGTPQGLAVYQNGVRINEAFGATVNWDLIPDIAIDRVTLASANPVYGLNALGGAMTVSMKNGFDHPGGDVALSGGSFGQRSAALEYGMHSGLFGVYVAARTLDEDGWRMFSADAVRQFYTDVGVRTDRFSLDLDYTYADNRLDGQGAAPVQELAVDRRLVFTGPQQNANRLNFLTLRGSLDLAPHWSMQAAVYERRYAQQVQNGNTTDYQACTQAPLDGLLCQPDGATPVTGAGGQALPDISDAGALPIGENDFESIRATGHGGSVQLSSDAALLRHDNRFTLGASADDAHVDFYSGAQIGIIDPQLTVLPSVLYVDTPEDSPFSATPVMLQADTNDAGIYATDTFDLTEALSLTASGRYDVAHVDLHDQRGTSLSGNNRYSHFNAALGATYALSPAWTVYAGVSANTRTPTASEIECSDPLKPCLLPSNMAGDPPNLRQVVAHTTELGARGRQPGRTDESGFTWHAGVFRTYSFHDIYGIATSTSSGFFQNIGSTRRQGLEAAFAYRMQRWSASVNYSYVDATFQSPLLLPSPANPHADADGDIQVRPGDRLPGIPRHRLKLSMDVQVTPKWDVGVSWMAVSSQYYFGDESNQNAPLPAYRMLGMSTSYQVAERVQLFAGVTNLLDASYATYGIYSDPTGANAPGVPLYDGQNGRALDNRFISPAAPVAIYGGIRIRFQ
jgi:iron complex outermembrane receptor protein